MRVRAGRVGIQILAVLIVVGLVGLVGWRVYSRIASQRARAAAAEVSAAIPVITAAVTTANLNSRLEITGSIEPDHKVALASQIPGKVVAVTVDAGDRVAQGQVLIRLDDSDIRAQVSQARAAVQAAEAARGMAQARLELALAGARPQERRQAEANAAQAQAAVGAAEAVLEALRKGARPQERAQAQQAVVQAQAGLESAKADLSRAEELFQSGAVSAQQLDAARTQYKVAQARYETVVEQLNLVKAGPRAEEIRAAEDRVRQAQAGLEAAQQQLSLVREGAREEDLRAARELVAQAQAGVAQSQAALEAAQVTLAKTVIRSPLTGAVAQREVDPGQSVMPSQPLLAVVDNRQVYVRAKVTESEVRQMRPGQTAEVSADAYPGETFSGAVSDILPAAQVETRSFYVRVRLANPAGSLKAGMFARCAVTIARFTGIAAPRQAVVEEVEGSSVFVVRNGVAHLVPVKLGVEQGDLVQVTSGLKRGDQVVVNGQSRLRDGDLVSVKEEEA